MTADRLRVVVVGAGFGGLSATKALASAPVDVTLVDRRNHHLFQPLLYQVATAGLSPSEIAQPIRAIVRRQRNVRVLLGEVTGIDADGRAVLLGRRRIPYDRLVLATGARHAYFGHDEWEPHAPGLKRIEDATEIRRRILTAFEAAESTEDMAERRRLLTFVVVGAGPTGVELAGAIVELARRALAADFRAIDPRQARVVLVEAGDRVLPAFPARLSAVALDSLHRLGVEVRLGAPVAAVDGNMVRIGPESVPTATVIWAAGVAASPAAGWLGAACDRAGRILVAPDLTVPDRAEIFAIGDTAAVAGADGRPLPGIAPVAKQQGMHVAAAIRASVRGLAAPAFRYRHLGNMATIGRKAAVADFGRVSLSGLPAWLLWGAAHVWFLIGFRNRIAVVLDWLWGYVTFHSGARLITGGERDPGPVSSSKTHEFV
ncbi:MAG: NAD(P)/FAD-dependent oxidoreductase [Alphaproteobacteria bacterium]